jgi:hypothetical protein
MTKLLKYNKYIIHIDKKNLTRGVRQPPGIVLKKKTFSHMSRKPLNPYPTHI